MKSWSYVIELEFLICCTIEKCPNVKIFLSPHLTANPILPYSKLNYSLTSVWHTRVVKLTAYTITLTYFKLLFALIVDFYTFLAHCTTHCKIFDICANYLTLTMCILRSYSYGHENFAFFLWAQSRYQNSQK